MEELVPFLPWHFEADKIFSGNNRLLAFAAMDDGSLFHESALLLRYSSRDDSFLIVSKPLSVRPVTAPHFDSDLMVGFDARDRPGESVDLSQHCHSNASSSSLCGAEREPGIDRGDLRLTNSFQLREARMGAIRAGQIKQMNAPIDEAAHFEDHSQRDCQRLVTEGHFLNRKLAAMLCDVGAVNE